jgi:hypothetical protein
VFHCWQAAFGNTARALRSGKDRMNADIVVKVDYFFFEEIAFVDAEKNISGVSLDDLRLRAFAIILS